MLSRLIETWTFRLFGTRAFAAWLDWMERRGSVRFIMRQEQGSPERYLDRYYLLRAGRLAVYLHRFWASDQEGVHCHPWANLSLVLTGGYFEVGHDGISRWRRPGAVRFRQAEVLHRVVAAPGTEGRIWTLFFHGRRVRKWGFMRAARWERALDADRPPRLRGVLFPRVVAAIPADESGR